MEYPDYIFYINQFGAFASCFAFYPPIIIGSDYICFYSIDYVTKLFQNWGQHFEKKCSDENADPRANDELVELNRLQSRYF